MLPLVNKMMPLRNASLVWAWEASARPLIRARSLVRRRLRVLFERFPMVGVFAVCLAAVGLEPLLGKLLSFGLLVILGSILVGVAWRVLIQKKPAGERMSMGILLLALAAFFAFYQQNHRMRTEARMAASSRDLADLTSERNPSDWEPIALRGVIEQPMSYRPAYLHARTKSRESASENDQLSHSQEQGWQSTSVLRVEEVRDGTQWQPVSFLVTLSIDERSTLLPGDRIEAYCKWRRPGVATNPGQHDTSEFFAQRGYSAQIKIESSSQIRIESKAEWLRLDRLLARIRNVAMKSMEDHVPFGMSTLACALVLGQRDMAAWELQEELLATGTIHMLAISGLHVEMISTALLVMGTLSRFSRRYLLLTVCLTIWAYSLLCGGNPPVMRAAIMMTLAFFAILMGWQYSNLNNLAIAGIVLMVARPSIVFEVGPQLSFVAVAVLILTAEGLAKRQSSLKTLILARETKPKRIARMGIHYGRELLRTSFWVWFLTAPIVWVGFHVISPIGILLNLLLWIPMLIALVTGLGMIFVGWLPVAGEILGFLCGTQLWLVDVLVGWGEKVPWGHFWRPAPPMLWMFAFYGVAIGVAALWSSRRIATRRMVLRLLGCWFLVGLLYNPTVNVLTSWLGREDCMTITFLDVGHGTNVWIETPDRRLWLYDAGRLGDHERSYRRIADALWFERHSTIDAVVLSHADSDHFNAMPGLLKRFHVKRFVTTPQVASHANESVKGLLRTVQLRKIPFEVQNEGWVAQEKEWSVQTLHPSLAWYEGSDNAASMCLLIEFGGKRILLPGDLEPPGLQKVLSELPHPIHVVMAPHHGSLNAQSHKLLEWTDPEVVVISGSQRANTSRVRNYFHEEDRQVFLTARDHAIRVAIRRDGEMTVSCWNDKQWRPTTSPGRSQTRYGDSRIGP
jgi:competence protein ComEC